MGLRMGAACATRALQRSCIGMHTYAGLFPPAAAGRAMGFRTVAAGAKKVGGAIRFDGFAQSGYWGASAAAAVFGGGLMVAVYGVPSVVDCEAHDSEVSSRFFFLTGLLQVSQRNR